MIKNTFKIDYQLKRDEKGRQMLFVSSYQNNIKIEDHFAGYIDDILTENKKQKEVIDRAIKYINGAYEMAIYTKSVRLEEENIEDLLDILKEVE